MFCRDSLEIPTTRPAGLRSGLSQRQRIGASASGERNALGSSSSCSRTILQSTCTIRRYRTLFSSAHRALSHGCVRVEDPSGSPTPSCGSLVKRAPEEVDREGRASDPLEEKASGTSHYFTTSVDEVGAVRTSPFVRVRLTHEDRPGIEPGSPLVARGTDGKISRGSALCAEKARGHGANWPA